MEQIKNISVFKKSKFWIVCAAISTCIVVAVCFLVNCRKDARYSISETDEIKSQSVLEQETILEKKTEEQEPLKTETESVQASTDEAESMKVIYEGKFDNIMGYSGYYVYYDGFPCIGYYYSDNGSLLAEVWGTKPEDVSISDLDGDGKNELISDLTWGDGVTDVVVYREFDGEIRYAYCTDLLDEPFDNVGIGSIGAEYLKETNKVKIWYWVAANQEIREKYYDINMDLLTWWKPDWMESINE